MPVASRLALAYALKTAYLPVLSLFALDARLAGLLRHSREPMLAQLRLSWWRETLGRDSAEWPAGEPLLMALRSWNGQHGALTALVDGWEAMTGPAPLPTQALQAMAQGRGDAFAALAQVLQRDEEIESARRLGLQWSLADVAIRLGNSEERAAASSVARERREPLPRVSRSLRPLLVLSGLSRHNLDRGNTGAAMSPAAVPKALRLGLLGF